MRDASSAAVTSFGSIVASGLALEYPIYRRAWLDRARAMLGSRAPLLKPAGKRVLDSVSFRIEPGESVGVLGVNGAGKSSLLRTLSGMVQPTDGTVLTRGRVMAMLDPGLWLRPSFTGRESLMYAALLLGLGTSEIQELIVDIEEFAELDEAMDQPCCTYPLWMRSRLAFALAVTVPSDILLLDEPLAAVDNGFAAKCLRRLNEIRASGRTIVLASNDLTEVACLTSRLLVLDEGMMKFDGKVAQGLRVYEHLLADRSRTVGESILDLQDVDVAVTVVDRDQRSLRTVEVGQPVSLTLTIRTKKDLGELVTFLRLVSDATNQPYAYLMPRRWGALRETTGHQDTVYIAEGETTITWMLPYWICGEGIYWIDAYLGPVGEPHSLDSSRGRFWDRIGEVRSFYGNFYLKGASSLAEFPIEDVNIHTPGRSEGVRAVSEIHSELILPIVEESQTHETVQASVLCNANRGDDAGKFTERKIKGILTAVKPYTMVHETGVRFAVEQVVELILKGKPGVVVECGVWRGGTSLAMLLAQRERFGRVEKPVYLLDSFEGLPPVAPADGPLAKLWQQGGHPDTYFDNCKADIEDVQRTIRTMEFREHDYRLIKGWFTETVPALARDLAGKHIALLRLDGDWYDSTMVCLTHLLPLVVEEGVVIVDDYYAWDGCAKAVHDYLSRHQLPYRIKSLYGCFGAYFLKKSGRDSFDEL